MDILGAFSPPHPPHLSHSVLIAHLLPHSCTPACHSSSLPVIPALEQWFPKARPQTESQEGC